MCKEYEVCVKKPRVVCVPQACPASTACPETKCCPAPMAGPFYNPCAAKPGLFSGFCDKLFKTRLGCDPCVGK